MRYLSICSGIEAATVAWHPLGWTAVGFAEIDPFASAVLAERFGSNMPGEPLTKNGVPNHGDFTAIDLADVPPVDLLVGGTPCQAFSFAGKRLSLADARGNLTLAYAVLAHELARSHGLKNALWENVPGVLSTDDNAFGCFLGALVGADDAVPLPPGVERWPDAGMVAGPRARAAWRLLDAQYFGLAQRRERVFVVVDFGNGADPAAVLFEPQGMSGNPPPRREARQDVAGTLSARTEGGGGLGTDFDLDGGLTPCFPINEVDAGWNSNGVGVGNDGDPCPTLQSGKIHGVAFGGNNTAGPIDVAAALNAHGGPNGRQDFESETFIAFSCKDHGADASDNLAPTLRAMGHAESHANAGGQIAVAHTLRGEGFDASEDGTGRGIPLLPVAFNNTGQGWWDEADVAATVRKGDDAGGGGARESTIISHTLRGEGFDAGEDGTGRGTPIIAVPFDTTQITSKGNYSNPKHGDPCHPLAAKAHPPSVAYAIQAGALRENPDSGPDGVGVQAEHSYTLEARAEVQAVCHFQTRGSNIDLGQDVAATIGSNVDRASGSAPCVAFAQNQLGEIRTDDIFGTLNTNSNASGRNTPLLAQGWAVRRLTTVECARLQGFPDRHAQIPWRGKPADLCPDGNQYKTYGNAMAVACMRWLGERIEAAGLRA